MLGYIFLFITALFYVGLAMLTSSRPSMAGDAGMGYGLVLVLLGIGFAVNSLILTLVITARGGFNWIFHDTSLRTAIVLLFWLFISITIFSCAVFKWEWHTDTTYPQFLHWLAIGHGQLWIPLLWLTVCFFSLNTGLQSTVPASTFKIPFWVGFSICTVFSGGLLVGYLRDSAKAQAAEIASRMEQEDRWHQENLNQIAAYKPEDPLINILGFSGRYQPEDIKKAALAKIKAHPDWETKLLELLKNEYYYREVYTFLDGNMVDHPEQFAEPLNQNIVWMATSIKDDIKNSNNLQHWSFDNYNIERLLRAIDDQFMNKGVDFYPTVVKLSQALKTTPPEQFKGVHFTVADVVESWLKRHKK
ncbi:hypothetical protein GXP67_07125 [Rhodocytophaga rosea]|uniref:Uncharacterized protein n=1 Tax=Rhodocytophaga rosea TaxID=2704465 RepID=A0A6C0GEN7_9BACT|nr:hypothetical protein [Rhodocytophaga rosea]QHT66445.1 hypothetical protein GXP67_07125 [Rhodocytophaga rosea]